MIMEKKRSIGVTIFGILFILGSLFQMLGLKVADYKFMFQPLPEKIILIRYFISVAVLILGVITGIGLLRLKNIFRKMALFLGFFTLYTYILESPFFVFKNMPEYVEQQFISIASTGAIPESIIYAILWTSIIVSLVIDFGFAGGLIYFFTRPKVKEQFR